MSKSVFSFSLRAQTEIMPLTVNVFGSVSWGDNLCFKMSTLFFAHVKSRLVHWWKVLVSVCDQFVLNSPLASADKL